MSGFFITGTDTDSGKTLVSLGLMLRLRQAGYRVNAMKPIAAGASEYPEGFYNADAWQLRQLSSYPQPDYALLNPYLFDQPVAPHLEAARLGVEVDLQHIAKAYNELQAQADFTLVEGAGGWRVPLGRKLAVSDLPVHLSLPVIMVVGLRLGCLNHAQLTLEAIQADGCTVTGWIASQVDPDMLEVDANIDTLQNLLHAPCLGIVPHLKQPAPEAVAENLDIALLEKQL